MGCGQKDVILCDHCRKQMPLNRKFYCPYCKKPSFLGHICFSCRPKSSLDGVWVASNYQNDILKKSIKAFKYNLVKDLAQSLAMLSIDYLRYVKELSPAILEFDLVLPVPLHKRKILERGFNQSELLGQKISQEFSWPYAADVLRRQRYTQTQAKLNISERSINIKDAFTVNDCARIIGKKILLIDDVITTGQTLNECARILKKCGSSKIWALVLAQG